MLYQISLKKCNEKSFCAKPQLFTDDDVQTQVESAPKI